MGKLTIKLITTVLLLPIAACNSSTERNYIAQEVLNIASLPDTTTIVDGNWLSGKVFGNFEYHLEIKPTDYLYLTSGREFIECETTQTTTDKAFIHFRNRYNYDLSYCEKSISESIKVAIYQDKYKQHLFILFDEPK
ncbi:MAG: hypothetical protein N0E54_14870 [Candidatus Thiodiazotropha taylori]|nr:hypothetical protein [Candidatus Thiodiazotropha endolucinida]MCW4230019.1 hypothetical protein [Candidatus Thiodiazotropha taylori]